MSFKKGQRVEVSGELGQVESLEPFSVRMDAGDLRKVDPKFVKASSSPPPSNLPSRASSVFGQKSGPGYGTFGARRKRRSTRRRKTHRRR
jgi:hypothetical protein